MTLLMCIQAGHAAKSLPTHLTVKWIVLRVKLLVHFQSIRRAVAFPTDFTALRVLFSPMCFSIIRVCPHVIFQSVIVHKGLPTCLAHEGLDRSMHWHVFLERAHLTVALATDVAGERFYARVITDVSFQISPMAKLLATRFTRVRLLSGVDHIVLFQAGLPLETLVTLAALPGLRLRVNPLVNMKGAALREAFPTRLTLIRLFSSVESLVYQ